jgi:hypothetical protein
MSQSIDAHQIEVEAYRARFDDGLIDFYVGLSLLWIGVMWVWFDDLAGLAGVLPAIAVAPFLAWRNSFIEDRAGYVKFTAQRRRWERRNLILAFAAGVMTFIAGIAAYVLAVNAAPGDDLLAAIGPGLIAMLLAIMLGGLALITGLVRLLLYAAVLAVGGVVAAVGDLNPGVPLLAAGVVVTLTGSIMFFRFVRTHPASR